MYLVLVDAMDRSIVQLFNDWNRKLLLCPRESERLQKFLRTITRLSNKNVSNFILSSIVKDLGRPVFFWPFDSYFITVKRVKIWVGKPKNKTLNSYSIIYYLQRDHSYTLTCQIILQQILLFFVEKNTHTTLLGPASLLIFEIFPSKPNFHLHKWEKILPTRPY